jgi:hypothetical protein
MARIQAVRKVSELFQIAIKLIDKDFKSSWTDSLRYWC